MLLYRPSYKDCIIAPNHMAFLSVPLFSCPLVLASPRSRVPSFLAGLLHVSSHPRTMSFPLPATLKTPHSGELVQPTGL